MIALRIKSGLAAAELKKGDWLTAVKQKQASLPQNRSIMNLRRRRTFGMCHSREAVSLLQSFCTWSCKRRHMAATTNTTAGNSKKMYSQELAKSESCVWRTGPENMTGKRKMCIGITNNWRNTVNESFFGMMMT